MCEGVGMARARNIKPSFFNNPELVELRYEVRLLFIGLWTIADREGRLEDRPKKIKMELFPADNIDVDAAISELSASGFVLRYEVGNLKLIQIVNFTKHQKPHHQEKQSEYPSPDLSEPVRTKVGVNPSDSLNTDSLNTDCGLLIADSPIPDTSENPIVRNSPINPCPVNHFDEFWEAFADKRGRQGALKVWNRKKLDRIAAVVIEGARRYVKTRGSDQRYWKQAQGWLNDGRWEDEVIERPPSSSDVGAYNQWAIEEAIRMRNEREGHSEH